MLRHPLARIHPVQRLPARGARNHQPPLLWRLVGDSEGQEAKGELARDPALALVEAVLFTADEPLAARRLATLANLVDAAEARKMVSRLKELYDRGGSAFQVEELAGGYQLLTRPAFHPWLALLRRPDSEAPLGPAARETLTIVAYRQPVTRADIEAVRGVGCSEVLRQLMERKLVRIVGKDDSLGRPVLYGTTKEFLQLFGLKSLRDLPAVEGVSAPGTRRKAEEGEP